MAYFKAAMAYHGLPFGHMREPALDLTDAEVEALRSQLSAYHAKYTV